MTDNKLQHKQWLTNLLRNHPAVIASGLYVFASVIGMYYSWAYLRHFGINVFNYTQIGDFLLASLKEPMTWGIVFASVLLMMGDNALSRRVQKRSGSRLLAWYGSPKYRLLNYVGLIVAISILIYAYARAQAKLTMSGQGQTVTVTYADRAAADDVTLLGTTGSFVFLLDTEHSRVMIHPLESIHAISFNSAN